MVRSQLGKTTASVSSYWVLYHDYRHNIEALHGPSAGPRFKEIPIFQIQTTG